MGVPETVAMTASELNKFEYLEPLLKNKRLTPNNIARTKPIFDFPKLLNIFILSDIACIIIVCRRENKYASN